MTFKKILFLLMTIVFIIGCEKDEEDDLNLLSIDLITMDNPTFFEKTVILFEDDHYLIKTNFDSYINTYPYYVVYGTGETPSAMHGYEEIKEQVTQDFTNHDVLLMTDYLYRANDSTYILAHHLENGSCLIFDKKRNEIISKIEKEEFTDGEKIIYRGGRRFYIKEDLFLEIVDLIS